MCTDGFFSKSKRFEFVKSKLISTQVSCATNTIEGDFRGSRTDFTIIGTLPDPPQLLVHNTNYTAWLHKVLLKIRGKSRVNH